jgi:hypothetical protein
MGVNGDILDTGICMKACPHQGDPIDVNHVHPSDVARIEEYNNYYSNIGTPQYAYKSHSLIDFCVPNPGAFEQQRPNEVLVWKMAMAKMLDSGPGQLLMDLYLSSRAIYTSIALAFVLSILYIYIMSMFAETLAWAMILLVQVGLIGMSVALFVTRSQEVDEKKQKAELVWGCITGVLSILYCLLVYCGFNQLRTAIDVIDASADFLACTKRIVLVPIVYFFVTMFVVLIWLGAMMSVLSMGDISAGSNQVKHISFDSDPTLEKKILYVSLFMLFGLLWIYNFLKA